MKKVIGLAVLAVPLTFVLFQNCGKNQFALDPNEVIRRACLADPHSQPDCFNLGYEKIVKDFKATPTDILFVLDNSCSMETVANSVRDGFNTMANSSYPDNTLMGVTYMSPARVAVDGTLDFANTIPYIGEITQQLVAISPGFMELVNKDTIAEFKSLRPSVIYDAKLNVARTEFVALYPSTDVNNPANKIVKVDAETYQLSPDSNPTANVYARRRDLGKFTKEGCTNGWFVPNEKNSKSQLCLDSAVQLFPNCTGAEPGLVSLEHLLKRYSHEGKKLFRDRSFVNIVMVSDTHEAGASYFGKEGSAQKQRTLAEIQAVIQQNNPTISSIKFSGVVPLPVVGDPKLTGLTTVGELPKTAADAVINSEGEGAGAGYWGYSYLPFIRGSRGVASHAANNDWSLVAKGIVDSSKYAGNILVSLKAPVKKFFKLKLNGVDLDLTKIVLSADKRSFTFQVDGTVNKTFEFEIEYEKEAY